MEKYDYLHKPDTELMNGILELLFKSFPVNECRPVDTLLSMLSWPTFSIYIEREQGRVAALMFSHDVGGMRFIENFCVSPELRNSGRGGHMLDEFIAMDEKPVVLEVEPPKDTLTCRRVGFYKRHGLVLDERKYIMPPLGAGLEPLRLYLMSSKPLGNDFERVRDGIYRLAYRVEPAEVERLAVSC